MAVRVLVVTSRTAFAEALSVALRASDLDYVGARRGTDAVTAVQDDLPGAVIIDLTSPIGALQPITDAVRAGPQGADVPIIFCGDGNQGIKSTTDALIAGGDGFFLLPAEAQRVVAKIATYVGCQVPELPASLVLPKPEPGELEDEIEGPPPSSEFADTTAPNATPRPVSIIEESLDRELEDATDSLALQAVEAAIAAARTRSGEGPTLRDGAAEAARAAEAEAERAAEAEAEAERAAEAEVERLALEEQRKAEEERREAEEERERAEEQRKAEEDRRKAEEERERAEEQQRRAEHERHKAEEERKRAELERDAAEQQSRRAEERSRAADEQRRTAEQQRKAAEQQRKAAEQRREAAEREAAEAEALAAARQADVDRQEAELARLDAEAGERIRVLEEQRRQAEQAARVAAESAQRAAEEAAERELRERARLSELEHQRKQAEIDARRALEEAALREREGQRTISEVLAAEERERARLDELQARRDAIELEAQQAFDELAQRRVESEQAAHRAAAEAAEREGQMRARLEELERERVRRETDLERAQLARRQREAEERARLEELAEHRRRVEERLRRDAEAQAQRDHDEQARLAALEEERSRAEDELRALLEERQREIGTEEQRLDELRRSIESATEREHARAEERIRLEAEAETRLTEARAERARLEAEAAAELEKLRHLRDEEELARRELDEKRTRARLAFQSGRLDAVAPGDRASGTDVGSRLRPSTDADGQVAGDPLLPQLTIDATPPPPPTMVPLEPPAGRFADGELPALLWACANLHVTGVLDVSFDDGRVRTVYFEEGEPVLVTSALPVDRPEEGLLRAGLITAARYNELRAGPLRSPRRTAAALVAEGVLKPEELFPAVRGVLTEQVLSLLEHDVGGFAWREGLAHAADRVRLEHRLDALIAEGVRRKFDERRLWLVLGGPASLVTPDDRARELPPLSPEEKLALVRLDGTRALEDVILETGIAPQVVLRTALIAIACGAARMLARGVPADPAERQAQRARSVAIDQARVLDRLHAARNGDYYSFLGLDVHASPFEVQRAAERLRQRFAPARFADPAFAELQAALAEIVEVTYDAEAVLGDEALAEGYRKNLLGAVPRLQRRRA
ncbi:MAG: hypothetical protein IT383_01270 [Deltaproteobacteria bacterium]|nr:hypothetical protein [Deltaproteobacteria bacterium]